YDENGSLVGLNYNGTNYYYYKNILGDILGIVNSSGSLVVEYTYDAWGNILSTTGSMASTLGQANPFRYRGYYYDAETGYYYLNSRYYDPSTCRFINVDSYVSTGQGILGNNMYAYCGNDPVNHSDPSGHAAIAELWTGGMWWLCGIDTILPIGDAVYVGGVVILWAIAFAKTIEAGEKLPNQGEVSAVPDAPPVDAGKQGKHVPGHNNDKDPTKSKWNDGENGVKATQEAWKNGSPEKPGSNIRIGRASDGRKVRVHIDKMGRIHGYPVSGFYYFEFD
ncbi:MAG: hypothetical protein IIX85_02050, partial [Clostridia bacterium]|nr:hypothetical protein [Clostridia bacterium]